ncbi:P-loop NTPase [Hydrogenoanaerobacterium sp.]|uniref:nucleotide-binding protein n=1 Tax=Hydrogenoanaerobacterium sp. TaxID=2953763 RepID=UPI0028A23393|nr:P-loop NTPase [Hydrogenoanaerobacterium sp.]
MMAKIIMITSGKGGVGKSSVCSSLGYHLARLGKKVLILEMDSGLRCLDIMLGVNETTVHDISDVLCGRCEPIKAIYESPITPNLAMMPATLRPDSPYSSELFYKLCKGLSHYYDYLLIETPAGFGRMLTDIAKVSDLALLVVTPDPISMRDAKILSDYLADRGLKKQRIIINKVKTNRGKLEVLPDLDVIIDTVLEPLIGVIPYEPEMVRALSQGRMLPVRFLAGRALQNIARRITGEFVELAVF